MRSSKRLTRWIVAIVLAVGASAGTWVTDGTSNTREQAGVSSSPGRTLARKAGGTHIVEYLAIPGIRGTGGGARS